MLYFIRCCWAVSQSGHNIFTPITRVWGSWSAHIHVKAQWFWLHILALLCMYWYHMWFTVRFPEDISCWGTLQRLVYIWISLFVSSLLTFFLLVFLLLSTVMLQICAVFLNGLSTSPLSHLGVANIFSHCPLCGFLFTLLLVSMRNRSS